MLRLAGPLLFAAVGSLFAAGCANEAKPAISLKSKALESPRSREARVALYERTLRARLAGGSDPLIDMEVSLDAWRNPARLIEGMNRAGVALAAVTAGSEEAIRKAASRHPGRLVPLTAPVAPGSREGAASRYFSDVKRQLDEGALGIGRVSWRSASSRDAGARLAAILRLSSETGAPLWIAAPTDDDGLGRLERRLRAAPEAKIIWTQAGRIANPGAWPGYGHGLLRALSLRRANLFFTLTQEPPPPRSETPGARKNHLFDSDGAFSPEWRALLEARVSHFMVGSGSGASDPAAYAKRTLLFRKGILARISRSARRRIAFQNAWRLLTNRSWKP